MTYVLESESEFDRLTQQNQDVEFSPEIDIQMLNLKPKTTFLDAGCGGGDMIAALNLLNPSLKLVGVDGNELRIAQLKNRFSHQSNIEFVGANLNHLPFPKDTFEQSLLRYVLQHNPYARSEEILREQFRCLEPGGRLNIVDVDGYLETLSPPSGLLIQALLILKDMDILDLNIARKLPTMLKAVGFIDIDWKIKTISFVGEARAREIARTKLRLENCKAAFKIAGLTDEQIHTLNSDILSRLSSETSVCYMNQFYITARKP